MTVLVVLLWISSSVHPQTTPTEFFDDPTIVNRFPWHLLNNTTTILHLVVSHYQSPSKWQHPQSPKSKYSTPPWTRYSKYETFSSMNHRAHPSSSRLPLTAHNSHHSGTIWRTVKFAPRVDGVTITNLNIIS